MDGSRGTKRKCKQINIKFLRRGHQKFDTKIPVLKYRNSYMYSKVFHLPIYYRAMFLPCMATCSFYFILFVCVCIEILQ